MMHAVRVQPDAAQNLIVSRRQDQRDVFLQVWLEDFVDVWGIHHVASLAFSTNTGSGLFYHEMGSQARDLLHDIVSDVWLFCGLRILGRLT